MIQPLVKAYFSFLVHLQVRFEENKGDILQIRDILCLIFLHQRANQAIRLSAFVRIQGSMQRLGQISYKQSCLNPYGAQQDLNLYLH